MDGEQDNSCPICAYQFSTPEKVPKILPCYHTFCSPCIDNIIASTPLNSDSSVKCPICRQDANIPKDGVQGFFDNYFRSAPQMDKTCDICGAKDILEFKHCKDCNSVLCDSCFDSHQHDQIKTKFSKFDDFDVDDSDDDDDENDNDRRDPLLRELANKYRKSVNSVYFGEQHSSFKCNNFESIRKIIPDDKNECWVLTNRPFVTKFTRSGKERYRKYVDNVLKDIGRFSDGTLVLAFKSGEILLLTGQELTSATYTDNEPTSIYAYQDGRLLISTRPHPGNTHVYNSELLISDQSMKKFKALDVNVDLQEVSSITVNEKNGQIALCETSKKCVYLVEQRSKKLKVPRVMKYEGKKGMLRYENTEGRVSLRESNFFQPRSVASDQHDNFFVLDAGSNLIHVLDGTASLQAVVLATISGSINCFNVDSFDNLWIGDMSGQIRVYSLELNNMLDLENRHHRSGTTVEIRTSTGDGSLMEALSLSDLGAFGLHRVGGSDHPSSETDLASRFSDFISTGLGRHSDESTRITDSFIRNTF